MYRTNRDEFRRSLDHVTQHTQPPVDPSLYRIDFIPVFQPLRQLSAGGVAPLGSVKDCYVVRVQVLKGSHCLYMTHSRKSYIRRDGSIYEMDALMIVERTQQFNASSGAGGSGGSGGGGAPSAIDVEAMVARQVQAALAAQNKLSAPQEQPPAPTLVTPTLIVKTVTPAARVAPSKPATGSAGSGGALAPPSTPHTLSDRVVDRLIEFGYDRNLVFRTALALQSDLTAGRASLDLRQWQIDYSDAEGASVETVRERLIADAEYNLLLDRLTQQIAINDSGSAASGAASAASGSGSAAVDSKSAKQPQRLSSVAAPNIITPTAQFVALPLSTPTATPIVSAAAPPFIDNGAASQQPQQPRCVDTKHKPKPTQQQPPSQPPSQPPQSKPQSKPQSSQSQSHSQAASKRAPKQQRNAAKPKSAHQPSKFGGSGSAISNLNAPIQLFTPDSTEPDLTECQFCGYLLRINDYPRHVSEKHANDG